MNKQNLIQKDYYRYIRSQPPRRQSGRRKKEDATAAGGDDDDDDDDEEAMSARKRKPILILFSCRGGERGERGDRQENILRMSQEGVRVPKNVNTPGLAFH